ncbi:hypothetical protein [Actinomadura macra]|uniref:hypothetical protein n=1 Tax=Actinomadura macra TaxID=46164 RepID=UPI00082A9E0E|nr:hypothetical protein [Actinomadura macra]
MQGDVLTVATRPRLALVGDRGNHNEPAHPKIERLLSSEEIDAAWVPTTDVHDQSPLEGFGAVWLVPGAPYKNQRGVHIAVRYARETGLPFLGTCGGFFSALIEHALNVQRLPEVQGVDEDPEKLLPLVIPLVCSLTGEKAPLTIDPGTRIAEIYGGATEAQEVFHCSYGLAADFLTTAGGHEGLRFTAWDAEGSPRALELSDHPFFLGTLFQPELVSAPGSLHPILATFLSAVRGQRSTADVPEGA